LVPGGHPAGSRNIVATFFFDAPGGVPRPGFAFLNPSGRNSTPIHLVSEPFFRCSQGAPFSISGWPMFALELETWDPAQRSEPSSGYGISLSVVKMVGPHISKIASCGAPQGFTCYFIWIVGQIWATRLEWGMEPFSPLRNRAVRDRSRSSDWTREHPNEQRKDSVQL
jgi:hypothetical protein